MANHIYWRVHITATGTLDEYFTSAAEVVFSGATGPVSTAGGTAFASSTEGVGIREPYMAFDADVLTLWSTGGGAPGPAFIGYQFPSAVDVTGVSLTSGDSTNRAARMPSAFDLQYSDDGSTWTTLQSFTGITGWTPSGSNAFSVTPTTSTPPGDAVVNCSVANCSVTIQVVPAPTVNTDVLQAQTIIFGAALAAGAVIWGVRRILGLFNTYPEH